MGLLSFLQPKAGAGADAVPADTARLRARRRLIGAAVLVAVGVIGLPLLFDTSPRPVSPDIAIETPDPAAAPRGAAPESAATSAAGDEQVVARGATEESRNESADPAPAATTAPPASSAAAAAPVAEPAEPVARKPAEPVPTEPARKPAASPTRTDGEAARARATLEGRNAAAARPDASEAAGRFVVQVGAFSEAGSARQLRQRLDKLGLKSYTQVVDTAAGKRIRVRVGPYGDRGEADRAAARLRQAGLQPAVLTL